ncbi:hypothetical protein JXL19_10435 [bacterium]|nr:hypothetical protein [bacterium]
MGIDRRAKIEKIFSSLSTEERDIIIRHGVAFRLSDLQKRLFLAESKVRFFEEKYKKSFDQLEKEGLPDNASFETHEDYIMWHHWLKVIQKESKEIESLKKIAQYGIELRELTDVSP